MIEFPGPYNAHNPWPKNLQQNLAVKPYVPMPMSQEQLRLIHEVENNHLQLTNTEQRLPRRERQMGIVLREPTGDHNSNHRLQGNDKRPIERDVNEARKKKKVVTEAESEEGSATSSTYQNPILLASHQSSRPRVICPLHLLGLYGP